MLTFTRFYCIIIDIYYSIYQKNQYIGEIILATFSYTAIDKAGRQIKGTMEASDRGQATALIKEAGNLPVSVNSAGVLNKDINLSFFDKKPTPRDMSVFCRQFVSITSAGVPITQALEMLAEQTENPSLKKALEECLAAIQAGSSFSEAMSMHPKVFPYLLITMVKAGEASGSLEVSFSRMAEQFEKDAKLRAMIAKSSVYPTIVLIVSIVVVVLMLAFVVPQFEDVLAQAGTELPALTVVVIAASDFMVEYWYFVLAVTIGLIVLLRMFFQTDSGKAFTSALQLKAPLFNNLAIKTASASTCRTLSTLVAGGIPLIDAIEIVSETMSNVQFRDALIMARDNVSMGAPLSEQFTMSKLYPPLVCHMTKIGEETGDLEGMMNKIADYYDEEVENATEMIMAAIEPATIIILALVIGLIVGAVMLPMVEMYNALGNL